MKACFWSGYGVKTSLWNNYIYDICIPGALMWFDGPNQILPIFHHLIWFDGPKNLMWFDGPKSIFSPVKTSCVLMDPKPHVIWWTLTRDFKFFPSQNLMCFDGPTLFWVKQCFVMPNNRYFTPKPNLNKPNLTRPNLITLT